MAIFSCLHTKESIFTNRLYVGLNQNESQIRNKVFSNGEEKKGLGMTEYGDILGHFLSLMGIAFKTKDRDGNDLYINKRSFCHLVDRLYNNDQKHNYFNIHFVQAAYSAKKNHLTQQRLEKIYTIFDAVFPTVSNKNIAEISLEIFSSIGNKPTFLGDHSLNGRCVRWIKERHQLIAQIIGITGLILLGLASSINPLGLSVIATVALAAIGGGMILGGLSIAYTARDFKNCLEFYLYEKPLAHGLTLEQVLNQDWAAKERNHRYINWLFPTPRRGTDSSAPILNYMSMRELKHLKNDKDFLGKLLISFDSLLAFFGGKRAEDDLADSPHFALDNIDFFLNTMSSHHNFLRITRIIESLCIFGYLKEAKAFYDFIIENVRAHSESLDPITLRKVEESSHYWRGMLFKYNPQLALEHAHRELESAKTAYQIASGHYRDEAYQTKRLENLIQLAERDAIEFAGTAQVRIINCELKQLKKELLLAKEKLPPLQKELERQHSRHKVASQRYDSMT